MKISHLNFHTKNIYFFVLYFDANANMYFLNIETCKCNISWSNQSFQAIFNTVKKNFQIPTPSKVLSTM